jgi:DNA repair protein RadA/Sms
VFTGRYEFAEKCFFYATSSDFTFKPFPALNDQHKDEYDKIKTMLTGNPKLIHKKVEPEKSAEPGEGEEQVAKKTLKEIDTIMSTEGGIMPATAMMLAGGPGSGKTTITLDMLSSLTKQGYRCLFVSGEMDQIGYYKYTRRMPQIQNVETLFLRDYALRVKDVLEHVFDIGYDIICVDSIAEVIDLYKDGYSVTEGMAEHWYLQLLDKHKKGNNSRGVNTSFISIQQQTKAGDFVGSNRLKHMMDSCAHIKKNKETGERSMWFSKNRDCGFDYTLHFDIDGEGVRYHFGPVEGEDHDE